MNAKKEKQLFEENLKIAEDAAVQAKLTLA